MFEREWFRFLIPVLMLFVLSSSALPQTPAAKAKAALALSAATADCPCGGACKDCSCENKDCLAKKVTKACPCGCSCGADCECSECDCGCGEYRWVSDGSGYGLFAGKQQVGYLNAKGVYRSLKAGSWSPPSRAPLAAPSKPVSWQPVFRQTGGC